MPKAWGKVWKRNFQSDHATAKTYSAIRRTKKNLTIQADSD